MVAWVEIFTKKILCANTSKKRCKSVRNNGVNRLSQIEERLSNVVCRKDVSCNHAARSPKSVHQDDEGVREIVAAFFTRLTNPFLRITKEKKTMKCSGASRLVNL